MRTYSTNLQKEDVRSQMVVGKVESDLVFDFDFVGFGFGSGFDSDSDFGFGLVLARQTLIFGKWDKTKVAQRN